MQLRKAAALCLALSTTAFADTTIPIQGIGTQVGAISTHVESVTYGTPQLVDGPAGPVYELHGTISGVGWGGTGIVARASNAHYAYELPWLARWPAHRETKTLVVYHHGGSPSAIVVATLDRTQGALNTHRFAEHVGDQNAGVAALVEGAAYLSMNRRGLRGDGRFSATYLTSEVAPLTAAEVNQLRAAIGGGDPSYSHPDLFAGAPVPVSFPYDSATVRDADLALAQVVEGVAGLGFRERFSVGTSAGAIATSGVAFGCSAIGAACVRTGGNHLVAYDAGSPRLFDGFIFNGFVYDSTTERADAAEPLTAPVFFLQGRGDERYQQPIHMAEELLAKGVTLDGNVWIYEIANLPHVTRDAPMGVPPEGLNGEAMRGYYGAAIRNLHALVAGEAAPPASRIGGRVVDGHLVFDVAGGTSHTMPMSEDLSLDGSSFGPMVLVRTVDNPLVAVDRDITTRWQAVTAALAHQPEVIVGPSLACRVGRYQLRFFGTLLTPFSPAELTAMYGSFQGYRACLQENLGGLADQRLYDVRVEPARDLAELYRPLFQ